MNYEDYVERPGDTLRSSSHAPAVNDKPEYYDKKWEFPRHRLSIEETIGEGEFGKVLRARADGIAGNEGDRRFLNKIFSGLIISSFSINFRKCHSGRKNFER